MIQISINRNLIHILIYRIIQFLTYNLGIYLSLPDNGRIYGITFIDNESRSVWNGSQLGRNLSANVFNDWWNNGNKPELKKQDSSVSNMNTIGHQPTKDFFEFISQEHSANYDLGLFSLLPDAQEVDCGEEQFANQMKKKSRRLVLMAYSKRVYRNR